MRASASSTPSNLPTGVRNWLRTRAAHARAVSLDMPVLEDGSEIERPAARHSISMRQPWPWAAADDEVQRHEHVLAARRAVREHGVQREVAAARVHAGVVVRHQRAGDAQVLLVAQQSVRHTGGTPSEQGADRRQRDVALVPGDAHADHFAALPFALADDAAVGNGGGVRASPGAGQREAGTSSARQARQIVVLLRVGAVVQQLGPSEFGTMTDTASADERSTAWSRSLNAHRRKSPGRRRTWE